MPQDKSPYKHVKDPVSQACSGGFLATAVALSFCGGPKSAIVHWLLANHHCINSDEEGNMWWNMVKHGDTVSSKSLSRMIIMMGNNEKKLYGTILYFEKSRSFSIIQGHRAHFLHGWARIPNWPCRIISQQLITPGATVAYPPVAWAKRGNSNGPKVGHVHVPVIFWYFLSNYDKPLWPPLYHANHAK